MNNPNPEAPSNLERGKEAAVFAIEGFKTGFYTRIQERITSQHETKQYHNWEHAQKVDETSRIVLDTIARHQEGVVTLEMESARHVAALGHDVVLEAEKNPATGMVSRNMGWREAQNGAGGNEWHSFQYVESEIKAFEERETVRCEHEGCVQGYLQELRRQLDTITAEAEAAIKGTIPSFKPAEAVTDEDFALLALAPSEIDRYKTFLKTIPPVGEVKALKIDQDNVGPEASLVTLAVAIGDLSQLGRLDFHEYMKQGNGEFRELHYVIDEFGAKPPAEISDDEAETIVSKTLDWTNTQAGFALWQWVRFENMLQTNQTLNALDNAEAIKTTLRTEFSEFKDNVEGSIRRTERLQSEYSHLIDKKGSKMDRAKLKRFYSNEVLLETAE